MNDLPDLVVVPPKDIAGSDLYVADCWRYLVGTIKAAGITLKTDIGLGSLAQGAWPIIVDGAVVGFDYSDYLLVPDVQRHYRSWFRFQYVNAFVPHATIASFPPISFMAWEEELPETITPAASGVQILHAQAYEFLKDSPTPRDRDLYARRHRARQQLLHVYGSRVHTARESQPDFWTRASHCLVSVHIPGSWNHMLDRAQHQLLAYGVCTISPEIWTAPLGDMLEPGEHYVRIRDDAADLVDVVAWCDEHREECRRIGRNARAFFMTHSTPAAIWRYVKRHVVSPVTQPAAC